MAGGGVGEGDGIVIDDLAALKAIADPLRHRIIHLLDEPRTVKEIAARLQRPADRLYYHLGLLEKHGIVRAVERRGTERRYQAAGKITIAPDLTIPHGAIDGLVANLLEQVGREYAAAGGLGTEDGVKRSRLAQLHLRLTEEERAELTDRLHALVMEFAEAGGDDDENRRPYGVITGIWPVVEG